jgi:hypothetical protein
MPPIPGCRIRHVVPILHLDQKMIVLGEAGAVCRRDCHAVFRLAGAVPEQNSQHLGRVLVRTDVLEIRIIVGAEMEICGCHAACYRSAGDIDNAAPGILAVCASQSNLDLIVSVGNQTRTYR